MDLLMCFFQHFNFQEFIHLIFNRILNRCLKTNTNFKISLKTKQNFQSKKYSLLFSSYFVSSSSRYLTHFFILVLDDQL